MDNKQLNLIAEGIMKKLPSDKDRQAVEKILSAALKILYGTPEAQQQTDEFMADAKSPEDIINGVVATLFILYRKSNNTMPWGPAIAAGQILLLEGLARASKNGAFELTEELVGDTTEKYIDTILTKLGISTEQIIDVARKASVLTKNGVLPEQPNQLAQPQGGVPAGGLLGGTV